ncbi:MAG: Fic family protein [Akkermansiaceae bacterium]|nr:Fic family protein [Akkermansiaceae bacterium]
MKRRSKVPQLKELIGQETDNLVDIMQKALPEALRMDRYLSWQELRHRGAPAGMRVEQWWLGIKLHRTLARQSVQLRNAAGGEFNFASTQLIQQYLHKIDRAAGTILMTDANSVFSVSERDKYLLTSLAEEAIMSSMLEGAVVTRTEARELIRSNRTPKDEHEQMVMNNYRTMRMILQRKSEPLTPDFVLSLHRSMVEGTLKNPDKAGELRSPADKVYIEDTHTGDIIHMPPPAEQLTERLKALCRFANAEGDDCYIHPIIRAIILHFQLAYDHPFVDGNGRTARSLFYWSMLHAGYWLFEYISISREIYRHSRSYYESFLNTEEDENDLNYFIIDQLKTILASIESLTEHLRNKQKLQEQLRSELSGVTYLNHRQRNVLLHFLQHPNARTSVSSHCNEYKVVRQTARTDLTALEKIGLLRCELVSREFIFSPVPDLEKRLKTITK